MKVNISLFLLYIVILSVKLWFFFHQPIDPEYLIYNDERNYYEAGANNFKEQGFSYFLTKRSLYNGPVNILWVYLFPNHTSNKAMNVVLVSLAGLLLFFIVRNLYDTKGAFITWIIFEIYPTIYHHSKTILTEPPFIFLLLLAIFLFIKACSLNKNIYFLFSGLVFGLATLCRPTTQYFPIFIIVYFPLITFIIYKSFSKEVYKKFIKFSVFSLILIAPYVAKNYFQYGKMGIATGSGAVLYLGNDHRKNGDEPLYSNMHFDTHEITHPYSHLDLEGDKRLTAKAKEFIKKDIVAFFKISIQKSFRLLFGYPDAYYEGNDSIIHAYKNMNRNVFYKNILEMFLHVFIGVSFLLSLFSKFTNSTSKILIHSLAVYFMALHSISFPIPRLFIPGVVFMLCLLPEVFRSKKVLAFNFLFSFLIIAYFTLFNFENDTISENKISFFDKKEIAYKVSKVKNFTVENSFYKASSDGKQALTLKFEKQKPKLNAIIIFEIENLVNDSDDIKLKIRWTDSKNFIKENEELIKLEKNTSKSYMLSPTYTHPKWDKDYISKLKLIFKLKKDSKIKINKIYLAW